MRNKSILFAAALVAAPAFADEGMWTLSDLPQPVYAQMQAYGFELPYDALYSAPGAVKDAVVNFSGYCSGVVVSPDGLVFTNHHCGFSAINKHSTVEHDYMKNGFYAETLADELPNENMFVSFMVSQMDVTEQLHQLGVDTLSPTCAAKFVDSLENAWSKLVKERDSTLRLELKPFYEGNKYYATTYRDFRDLRLVFTVPKSMGKFGGETDNWMWPRQTCDFSVFRIYADPETNGPADYSPDNVPYKPAAWAKVSLDGYQDGSFSMTVGYPGSTSRYLSSYGIREMRDAENAPRAQVRGVKQEVMWRRMQESDAVRIKYETAYAQSSNYWKNSIGMNKCIDSIGLIADKAAFEQKVAQYVDTSGYLRGKLDLDELHRAYDARFEAARTLTYFAETFYRTSELVRRAMAVHNGMEVKGPEDKPKKQYVEFDDNSDKWDEGMEREVLAVLLKNYRERVSPEYLPGFYATIDKDFGGDCAKYVDYVWKKSQLMKPGAKLYVNKSKFLSDPGVALGLDVTELMGDLLASLREMTDTIALQERYLCAAKLRMEEDMPNYSDANFTMRLSYGQVGGFMLGGSPSGYYTSAPTIVEKMKLGDSQPDYFAEPEMISLMSATDFGRYADRTTGDMHLCFLTNNDITGGNSGSPMFDGKGQLIGLAFDGNWDSLSNDIFFDTRLGRCIGVDIRYVVYLMDKWGHADRLLNEIFPD